MATARLLQWLERFALPEVTPLRGHLSGVSAVAEPKTSSHLFFTVPLEKNNSYLYGVSCYATKSETLVNETLNPKP